MNSKNRRLTPSLIISILALFVAIGGTSYAAVKINGKDIKKGTVAGKALKKNTVTGAKIKESSLAKVPSAQVADSAAKATTADSATKATTADSALNADKLGGKTAEELSSPGAFALYNDGDVPADEARNMSAANFSEDGGGIICVSGLSFDPKYANVTTYRVGGGTSNEVPNLNTGEMNFCPETAQAEIQLVDGATSNPDTEPRFYIGLYR